MVELEVCGHNLIDAGAIHQRYTPRAVEENKGNGTGIAMMMEAVL